jgi:hypothetical protein
MGNMQNIGLGKRSLGWSLFLGSALAGIGLALWRCYFGFDGFDEAFLTVSGFKLYSLGDAPFVHEILSGPRQHDLLNYLFVRPWLPFDFLTMRFAAVVVYAALLMIFTVLCFGGQLGITAGLVYFGCVSFDFFLMPTWSYNWWCRNALLAHHICLLVGLRRPKWQTLAGALAGVAMAIAILAYNPVGAAWVGTVLVMLVLHRYCRAGRPVKVSTLAAYAGATSLVLAGDAFYLIQQGLLQGWWVAMTTVATERFDAHVTPLTKIVDWAHRIFWVKEFWFVLLVSTVMAAPRWLGETWARRTKIMFVPLVLASGGYLIWKLGLLSNPILLLVNLYVPLSAAAAVYLFARALKLRDGYGAMLAVSAFATSFCMSVVSVNGVVVAYFIAPVLIVPFFARLVRERTEARGQAAFGVLILIVVLFGVGSYRFNRDGVYRDYSPEKCDATMQAAPLTGIRTNARRAFLFEELARITKGRKFILAYNLVPSVFIFNDARSAADSTQIDSSVSGARNLRSFESMIAHGRYPDLIVRANSHPWAWGGTHETFKYEPDDLFNRYTDCARAKPVVNYFEIDAYEVDPTKAESCARELVKDVKVVLR